MEHRIKQTQIRETKHDADCDCGICQYCNGTEDVYGKSTTPIKIANLERDNAALRVEVAGLRDRVASAESDVARLETATDIVYDILNERLKASHVFDEELTRAFAHLALLKPINSLCPSDCEICEEQERAMNAGKEASDET